VRLEPRRQQYVRQGGLPRRRDALAAKLPPARRPAHRRPEPLARLRLGLRQRPGQSPRGPQVPGYAKRQQLAGARAGLRPRRLRGPAAGPRARAGGRRRELVLRPRRGPGGRARQPGRAAGGAGQEYVPGRGPASLAERLEAGDAGAAVREPRPGLGRAPRPRARVRPDQGAPRTGRALLRGRALRAAADAHQLPEAEPEPASAARRDRLHRRAPASEQRPAARARQPQEGARAHEPEARQLDAQHQDLLEPGTQEGTSPAQGGEQ
jgi:hypothetical protein